MVTRITQEEQKQAGFDDPRGFSEALTDAQNALDETVPTFEPGDLTASQEPTVPDQQNSARVDEELARADRIEQEFGRRAEQAAESAVSERRDRVQDIVGNLRELQGQKQEALVQEEEQRGLPEKQERLNEVEEEIATMQAAHRERVNQIETRAGATGSQVRNLVQAENRRHAFNLANQEIIRDAVSGSIERIKNAAQRKVDLQFEGQEQEIQLQKDFLADNRQLLKEAQRERLNQEIKRRERRFKTQKEKAQTLEQQKADIIAEAARNNASNATLASIRDAETIDEAFARASGFLDRGARAQANFEAAQEEEQTEESTRDEIQDNRTFSLAGSLEIDGVGQSTTAELLGLTQDDLKNVHDALQEGLSIDQIVQASDLTFEQAEFLRQNAQNIKVEGEKREVRSLEEVADKLGVTTRDLNKGLVASGMSLEEFMQLSAQEQRTFIFGEQSSSSRREP